MNLGKVWDKTETLEYVRCDHFPADFEPGQQYRYSNTNYTILGLVIEAVTGNDATAEIQNESPIQLVWWFISGATSKRID